jgi:hypothetical protein
MATGEGDAARECPKLNIAGPDAETLKLVAWKRYAEGLSWEAIAEAVGHDPKTLYRWRHGGPEWDEARLVVIEELKHQGGPEAWGCLVRMAHHNDVSAAKEILNRLEGAVKATLEMTGKDGGPVQVETFEHIPLAELAAIASDEPDADCGAGSEGSPE